MKRVSFLLYGVAFAVLFLCGIIVVFSGSLWFLRSLVSEHSGQYVGYNTGFLKSNVITKGAQEKYAHFLPSGANNFNRFVYKKDNKGGGEYIVGIPKIFHQFSLVQELKAQSFAVRRVGWIVFASKGTVANSNLFTAMGKTFSAVFIQGLPIRVQMILQIDTIDSASTALYIEKNRNTIHSVIHVNSSEYIGGTVKRMQKDVLGSEATFLALQSNMLPSIPSGFASAVESKVSELLHFTKTHPSILQGLLAENKTIFLSIEESSVAIGVQTTNDKTATLIHTWMQNEQGTRHPQKKAFALPDKTIGYEYLPGTSNAHFSLRGGTTNCLPSEEYDEKLFLCGMGDILVLANEERAGSRLVELLTNSKVLEGGLVQTEVLQAVGLAEQFEKIEYATSGNRMDVWADSK